MIDIAVLIPHYNNPSGLELSMGSIGETEKVDVVIVDDGSVKHKVDEAKTRAAFKASGEVFFLYLEQNLGVDYALNFGLDFILEKKYKYTARLDAGDICVKDRYAIQQKFLEDNPNIKLVGTNVIATDTQGNFVYNIIKPETHKKIKRMMYLNSTFIHPSVMFDNEIIKTVGKYPLNYTSAEDYGFFFKIVQHFETRNLQELLLIYEINPNGVSLSKRDEQIRSRLRLIKDNFYFGFFPIYGLFRNIILYYVPNNLTQEVKKLKAKIRIWSQKF